MKLHIPLGKPEPWVVPLTVVCLVLGVLIAILSLSAISTPEDTDLRTHPELTIYKRKIEEQDNTIAKLQTRIQQLVSESLSSKDSSAALQREINELRIRAGVTPLQGPGIVINIDDSAQSGKTPPDVNPNALITHDYDLMLLINELRSAGAEALVINDQRIVGSTAIRCVGPVIYVNNSPVSAPFKIIALGKPDTLYGAVYLPYGVIDTLKPLGIHITVEKRDLIDVPAVTTMPPLEVSHVVTRKGSKEE